MGQTFYVTVIMNLGPIRRATIVTAPRTIHRPDSGTLASHSVVAMYQYADVLGRAA
jgi:hypothetical protein